MINFAAGEQCRFDVTHCHYPTNISLPAVDWLLPIDRFFFPLVKRILMHNQRENQRVHEYVHKYKERSTGVRYLFAVSLSNVNAKIFLRELDRTHLPY